MTRRLLLIFGLFASSVSAQQGPVQLSVVLPQNSAVAGPSISVAHALRDQQTRELLQSGYTTRLHFRVELWRKSGWFYNPVGADEWDVLVSYDPAAQSYQVMRGKERERIGGLTSLDSAEALVEEPTRSSLHPDGSGRYYYNAAIDIQALSVSDLDAALGWLQGPVKKKENLATSFLKGVELIFSRIVGGQTRHFEAQSGVFELP